MLAHEFQHLIQAHDDRDETAWVNEGLSEDASMLVGGAASTIESFEAAPSTQLNAWDSEGAAAHYGASAAFFRYLTSRFGGDPAYLALAQEQGNGAAGVDQFLTAQGSPLRFRDAFGDWMAANILNDQSGAYANPKRTMNVRVDETLSPGTPVDGEANQFGADYYRLALGSGSYSLSLSGQRTVSVLPTSARGAGPMIWSNAAATSTPRVPVKSI